MISNSGLCAENAGENLGNVRDNLKNVRDILGNVGDFLRNVRDIFGELRRSEKKCGELCRQVLEQSLHSRSEDYNKSVRNCELFRLLHLFSRARTRIGQELYVFCCHICHIFTIKCCISVSYDFV